MTLPEWTLAGAVARDAGASPAFRNWTQAAADRRALLGLLRPILGLRITAAQIDQALADLGPTGYRDEAYVKVAAQAVADTLRLARP